MSQTLNKPYEFWKAPSFDKQFAKLSLEQQNLAKETFKNTFVKNPFDPSLRTHKINHLSARYKTTVWSSTIDGDLRVVFYIDGNKVWSFGIATHSIYGRG